MVRFDGTKLVADKKLDLGERIRVLNLFLDTADLTGLFAVTSEVTVADNCFSELNGDLRGEVPERP